MLGWMEVWRGLTGAKFGWMDFSGGLTGSLFDWSNWVGGLTGPVFDWAYSVGVRPQAGCGGSNWGGVRPGQCSIRRTEGAVRLGTKLGATATRSARTGAESNWLGLFRADLSFGGLCNALAPVRTRVAATCIDSHRFPTRHC